MPRFPAVRRGEHGRSSPVAAHGGGPVPGAGCEIVPGANPPRISAEDCWPPLAHGGPLSGMATPSKNRHACTACNWAVTWKTARVVRLQPGGLGIVAARGDRTLDGNGAARARRRPPGSPCGRGNERIRRAWLAFAVVAGCRAGPARLGHARPCWAGCPAWPRRRARTTH